MSESSTSGMPAAAAKRGGVFYLYKHLWEQSHGRRAHLMGAVVLLLTAQCVLLSVPYFAGRAINVLQASGASGIGQAGVWLALVVVATALSWVFHGPGRLLERNVALEIRRRISGGLLQRLLSLPLSWHETNHSGVTAHRLQQSSSALSSFTQSQFIYLSSAVRLVGPIVALWLLQPYVGLSAIVGFVLICVSVIGFDRAMIRLAHRENDAERRYSAALLDALGNITSVFALRQARAITDLIQRRLEAIFAPMRRSIVLNEAKWCTVDICSKVLSCSLVALFAWLAVRHTDASVGQKTLMLGSLYMVWEYASQAAGVISTFASNFQNFARQHADYGSADTIREAPVKAGDTLDPEVLRPSSPDSEYYMVRDLVFSHPGARTERPTLNGVSLSLQQGRRYALIGGSGSGKSTLLRVLAGLYEADRVAIDRRNGPALVAPSAAAQMFRANVTLVPQDAEVLEGTLAENLALCATHAGAPADAQYSEAMNTACVSDFIPADANGLNTAVVERGANWSGGQRARIALARGVLAAADSNLVLFDEPTAALDSRTEARVYDNIFAALPNSCIVSSIHRLHLLDRFDEVIVMHEGRVVAQGPAALLAATSPDFRQLLAMYRQEDRAAQSQDDSAAA
ncbi:ATP-binding cassette domain-containing protein [Steroidobacter agaridevorans]|uniref:ATP-binding cassette domain-containing protein n=1 Tax=Steroidobacter agaridevorans TaxID=2695856 RepID=UPI0013295CAA|nr:ABC transporter ATP-binding protein [Steroidobacter agaridevorans]GFE90882.1 ABC transporter [Steroidobacter agaridevorans]